MARTFLLRIIKKWAKELHLKESIADNGGPASDSSLTRREFIAGLGAAGMLTLLPKWAKAGQPPRIAIVGGGIAGLTCALKLYDRGVKATIYEASHRVGGRMFSKTDYWDENQISEWCGELIDSGHQTVHKLAKRFGLPMDDLLAAEPENAEELYYFFGDYYTYDEARADFAGIFNKLKDDLQAAGYPTRFDSFTQAGYELDSMSIYDWIETRIPGGHASRFGQLLDVAYNIEYGAETTDQSALNLIYLLGYQPNSGANAKALNVFGVSDERYHIRGGNQQLPEAIKNYLGDGWFHFGAQLTQISQTTGQEGYRLEFQSAEGEIFEELYDYVILAIPFAVLREIDYSEAGFDELKTTAIQELGRGRNGKLQLQFLNRLWHQQKTTEVGGVSNGSTYSDTGYQASWEVTRAQPGTSGILNLYSGGEKTAVMMTTVPFATELNPQAAQDAINGLLQMEPVFPGAEAAWNGKVTQSLPHLSSFFKASYSYYRVGQYTTFGGYEKVSQGKVLFCGEHTSQDFQGFMEGGASEGERAAKELLQAL
ncbi:MAG: flavin monoamine oxidase family protein [Methylosarcina sp.]